MLRMTVSQRCQNNQFSKRIKWAEILLVVTAVALPLFIAETVLRVMNFSPHGFRDEKRFVDSQVSGPGWCYPTNPRGYFPIDLTTQAGLKKLIQLGVAEEEAKEAAATSPYCVVSNQQQRRTGDFPGRQHTVAIIGDSFAFGEGLKEEDTLAHLMSLKTDTVNFRNFGISGARLPVIEEEMADVIVSAPEATKVIYVYNLNDMYQTDRLKSVEAEINDLENVRWFKKRHGVWNSFVQKSKLLLYLDQRFILRTERLKTIAWYNALYKSAENRSRRERAFADIVKISEQSENAGKQFTMMIYPLLYKSITGEYPFAGVHAIMMEFCERSRLHCLDASRAFDDARNVTKFTVHDMDFHPNELANQKVVNYLFAADPDLFR